MNIRKILLKSVMLFVFALEIHADIDRNNWMAALPDKASLFSLSIPGTHDAGTKGFSWNAECQRLSIGEQLSIGVRAFDLRPGVNGSTLYIYHSELVHGSETLGSIFDTYDSFLAAHPSEFLFVFLKNEAGDGTKWAELMKQVLDAHANRLLELNPYMTVEQIRGKILVLSRDNWGDSNYGAVRANSWQDNTTFDMTYRGHYGDELQCRIQDIYDVTSDNNLNRKKTDIERLLGEAMAGTTGKFYINHTSGYTKSYFLSNRYVAECAEKCNEVALNYLSSHSGPTGIIMMDFAGTDNYSSCDTRGQILTDAIIQNCQATALAPAEPGPEWVLPMGADIPWTGRVYRKDATSQTSSAVDGLRPPSNWNRVDYDDSEWQELTFPLGSPGYSHPYVTRWIGEYNCYWIRREFTLEGYTSLLQHTLRVFHDDDYKVYVNGSLVLSGDGWTTDTPIEKNISRYLKNGRNVIAAQVQQNNGGAYFDCGIFRTGEAIDQIILDETSLTVPDGGICLSIKVNKKITQNTWTSLCLPFGMTAAQISELLGEGTEVREPCAFSGNGEEWLVAFDEVSTIKAGSPCLVRVPATINSFELTPDNGLNLKMTVNTPITITDSDGNKLTFTGYYAKSTVPQGAFTMINNSFDLNTSTLKQNGYCAYLEAQSADGTEVKRINFVLGNADGIEEMTATGKYTYYDLSGRRIAKPQNGIYIQCNPDGRTTKHLTGRDK